MGTIWLNTQKLIIWQIIFIYGWLIISLCIWDIKTFQGLMALDHECFRPLKVNLLNLMTMLLFYSLILSPYLTVVAFIPFYIYEVFKAADKRR